METPHWINGNFKWYIDKQHQDYLAKEQANNLPPIKNLRVFRVVNEVDSIDDYVIINDKQELIKSYTYNSQGAEQLEAFINVLKISKHYDDNES